MVKDENQPGSPEVNCAPANKNSCVVLYALWCRVDETAREGGVAEEVNQLTNNLAILVRLQRPKFDARVTLFRCPSALKRDNKRQQQRQLDPLDDWLDLLLAGHSAVARRKPTAQWWPLAP